MNMPFPSVPGGPTLIDVDIVAAQTGAAQQPSRGYFVPRIQAQIDSRTKNLRLLLVSAELHNEP